MDTATRTHAATAYRKESQQTNAAHTTIHRRDHTSIPSAHNATAHATYATTAHAINTAAPYATTPVTAYVTAGRQMCFHTEPFRQRLGVRTGPFFFTVAYYHVCRRLSTVSHKFKEEYFLYIFYDTRLDYCS